ncbi:MAG: hypothetical protein QOI35_2264, partial [Cryptosporangiaceae bacterium]|nr:hypothetical protein [Cryptosporangiaceae bacterium]
MDRYPVQSLPAAGGATATPPT